MKTAVFLLLAVSAASGLYSEDDDVIELGSFNFDSLVKESNDLWLVEFYAPWCGHCKNMVPEYKKVATALRGIANVGSVDATAHEAVGQPYGVSGFPTIMAFSANKEKPEKFKGEHTAKALASFALKEVREIVKKRLGIKGGSAKKPKAKKTSDVVEATEDSFQKDVMENEDLVLVEFYAPWCGHCKNLAPEWKKAATELKGKGVTLVAVDATIHSDLAKKYGVSGYPTIKVFAKGPKDPDADPTDYDGGRTSAGIVEFATGAKPEEEPEEPSAVIKLTDADFEQQVMESKDLWIVEFFAPWCGHCKSLAPEWRKASDQLAGKVKLATVDCTVEKASCENYGVQSFPTIKVFGADKSEPEEYEGGRVEASIVSAAEELLVEMTTEPRAVTEITSQEAFDEQCGGSMCLVAFLPHILDSGASGREAYLEMLRVQAVKYKKQQMGFMWAEAAQQSALESLLDMGGGGYPALTAVSVKKGLNIPFFGGFSLDNVSAFVKRVMSGKEKPIKFKAAAAIVATTPWDGKDGEAPKEEL